MHKSVTKCYVTLSKWCKNKHGASKIIDTFETYHVPRQQIHMDWFKEALEYCELDDLRFAGDAFTWRNNHHDPTKYIHERLDRAVASSAWQNRFPAYKVTNGDPRHSDHRPIIIKTHGAESVKRRGPARGMPPRFEAQWF
jgi:hypothetical protein